MSSRRRRTRSSQPERPDGLVHPPRGPARFNHVGGRGTHIMLQEKLSDPAHQSMFAAAFDPKIFATAPGIEAFRDDLMILAQKMVEIGFRELPYTWIAVDE